MVDFVLRDIGSDLSSIMTDSYGNYFCQGLLSCCSGYQRLQIVQVISSDFIRICCDKKGTHTIQAIFDTVNLPEEEELIKKALKGHIFRLSMDSQGTHVVQKALNCRSFKGSKSDFVFEEIYKDFYEICTNRNGLIVVKILVKNVTTNEKRAKLMGQIGNKVIQMVQDPYGNYAVSEIISNWDKDVCRPIYEQVAPRLSELSV